MSVVCVDPTTDPLWQRLIDGHRSDVFHTSEWMCVLADTYGFEPRAYIVLNTAGEPCAGLPFCLIEDVMGKRIASLPFSDYCDPLVSDQDECGCLLDQLSSDACPVLIRCLHCSLPLSDARFELAKQAKWHGLDLRPDLDHLWRGLSGSARRAIQKAQREGVVVRAAEREETLRAFYELHLRVRKYKYHLLAQPYRFFQSIWHHLVETHQGVLIVAVYQDEIVGGVMFLEWQNRLYYKFNASVPTRLPHRPNDMLIWEGIKYGKAKGYTFLDFGLSDWDQEGLVRYKRKFASEEKTISFLRYSPREGSNEQQRQLRSLFPQLTDLLTDETVPDHVTEKAGEVLYRFFA